MFTSVEQNSGSMHLLVSHITQLHGLATVPCIEPHMCVRRHASGLVLRFAADDEAIHVITAAGTRSGNAAYIPQEPIKVTLVNNETLHGTCLLHEKTFFSTHFRFRPTAGALASLLLLVDWVIANAAVEAEATALYAQQSTALLRSK